MSEERERERGGRQGRRERVGKRQRETGKWTDIYTWTGRQIDKQIYRQRETY